MIWKNNKLVDLKTIYLDELKSIYNKNESLELLNLLIIEYFGLSRSQQALNPEFRLTESEMLKLHNAVKDLKKYKPIQYILGYTEFCGLKFNLNESVLIPRPETEELVNLIVSREKLTNLNVIDIGTGSACIAISLKKLLFNATVAGLDVSSSALEIAKSNASLNNLDINFHETDIRKVGNTFKMQFDIIVSNPPYVRNLEKEKMQANVIDYEPHLALFVPNDDPLLFYRSILDFSKISLKPHGRVYFEINEELGVSLKKLVSSYGFKDIELHKDIHEKNRMLSALKL